MQTYKVDLAKFLHAALQCIGSPYIWGAKGLLQWTPAGLVDRAPWAFDCSGVVTHALYNATVGENGKPLDWRGTHGARQLEAALSLGVLRQGLQLGDICFFGKPEAITHVGIYIARDCMLEAAAGDRSTTTLEEAQKRNACVRVSNYMRKDFVAARRLPDEITA